MAAATGGEAWTVGGGEAWRRRRGGNGEVAAATGRQRWGRWGGLGGGKGGSGGGDGGGGEGGGDGGGGGIGGEYCSTTIAVLKLVMHARLQQVHFRDLRKLYQVRHRKQSQHSGLSIKQR